MLRVTAFADEPTDAQSSDPVAVVRAVLDQPDSDLDYLESKLAFDAVIDPNLDRK